MATVLVCLHWPHGNFSACEVASAENVPHVLVFHESRQCEWFPQGGVVVDVRHLALCSARLVVGICRQRQGLYIIIRESVIGANSHMDSEAILTIEPQWTKRKVKVSA